ncbi:MAG: GGDEF domain-containing protein [Pseudomonadota bacterium]
MRHPLAFPDHALERAFREQYAENGLPTVRLGLALGALLYALFGVLDAFVAPDDRLLLWSIRALVVLPPIASFLYSMLRTKRFLAQQQEIMAATTLLGGLGILAMLTLAGDPIPRVYPSGLVLVLLWGFFNARVRFEAAALVGATLVVAYAAVALLIRPVPAIWALSSLFFLVSSLFMGGLAAFALERLERQRFLHLRTIEEVSVRDPLTGLFNRRHLEDRIAELAALRRRYGATGCLVLLDLDGFKAINDLFGHWSGDRMLREVARQLVANARATDLVFRYGGDEFCLLLPSSNPTAARAMLERVRAALREQPVGEGAAARIVDLSAGCIAIPDRALQPADLIAQADELLLAAKRLGKGRILLREEEEDDEETETARGL